MSCQPTLPTRDADRLDYALPLSEQKAAILAEQLLPAHLGDQKGLISTLESIGRLFTSLPELQKLDTIVVCQPEQSRVSDAHLEWLP
jgi:hypothetical protein